jgi:tripartite-type tricarboxylate transporter receptor subunit TctC
MRQRVSGLVLCAVALAFAINGARAQDYPDKPVRFIVGFSPGGGSDILARLVSEKLTERWGRPVVVDNRSGAGGTTALTIAARAAADGYTLLMISGSQITNATFITRLRLDIPSAFTPVTQATSQPYLLVAHPSVPVKTVRELVALAKAKPGQLNYASAGTGSFAHLGMELFKNLTGVEMVHIPFKGSGQALIDLLAGQVQVALTSTISGMPHVNTGKLKALAVTSLKRSPVVPDLPTVAESGVAGFSVDGWYGVVVPAGTPAAIVNKLNADIVRLLATQAVRDHLAKDGAVPAASTPGQFAAMIREELEKWSKVIATSGIKVE